MRNAYLVGRTVYLRPLEEDDAIECHVWLNDPEVRRTLAARARAVTVADSREFIAAARARGDQLFAIVTCADGVYIGNAGLESIDAVNRRADLGIVIGRKELWGRGYATETVALLCGYAFETLNLHRVSLACYANNPRALRIYERLGFRIEGRRRDHVFIDGEWFDEITMGLLAGELRPVS